MFRPQIFEVCLEETEQNLDRVGRVGNVKAMLVVRLVRPGESVLWRIGKSEAESEFLRNEVERAEA